MTVKIVKRKQSIRGNPKCKLCEADIRELFNNGKPVYSKKSSSRGISYYCAKCKADLFGGVKLREDEE